MSRTSGAENPPGPRPAPDAASEPGSRRAGESGFDAVAIGGEIQRRLGVKTSRDEPLARFSTMRVGGPADLFAVAHNAFELRGLVRHARTRGIPHLVLGRASDVVISDRGVRGLVIQVRAEGLRIAGDRLTAEAGVPMARAATETANAGLAGLEFGLAIPGTVGGAVWANAGAHGQDVASVIESADVLLADGREVRLGAAELDLGYRDSRLKHLAPGEPPEIVVAATFRLEPRPPAEIRERLDEIRRWRREHQPLGMASAGSVFRNPLAGPSAGELIDRAGLKGRRVGGAVVSDRHANFIVNDRRGTADDVRRLVDVVRTEVERQTGVRLETEVEFVGDWRGWPGPSEPVP
jgi:UDP-N-acetylmuramate dehydrogenase